MPGALEIASQLTLHFMQYFVVCTDIFIVLRCYSGISIWFCALILGLIGMQLSYWFLRMSGPGYVEECAPELLNIACYSEVKCHKCNLNKPMHSHHCSACKKCVLLMDHHCIWLGVCIGYTNIANYVRFLSYTLYTALLHCLITIVLCRNDGFGYLLRNSEVILIAILFVFSSAVIVLVGFLLVRAIVNFMNGETVISAMKRNKMERNIGVDLGNGKGDFENLRLFLGNNVFMWLLPQVKLRSFEDYAEIVNASRRIPDSVVLPIDDNEEDYFIPNE